MEIAYFSLFMLALSLALPIEYRHLQSKAQQIGPGGLVGLESNPVQIESNVPDPKNVPSDNEILFPIFSKHPPYPGSETSPLGIATPVIPSVPWPYNLGITPEMANGLKEHLDTGSKLKPEDFPLFRPHGLLDPSNRGYPSGQRIPGLNFPNPWESRPYIDTLINVLLRPQQNPAQPLNSVAKQSNGGPDDGHAAQLAKAAADETAAAGTGPKRDCETSRYPLTAWERFVKLPSSILRSISGSKKQDKEN